MSDKKNHFKFDNYSAEASQEQMILPPGTENNQNSYGVMQLKFGNILYLNTTFSFANTKFKVKFWGQKQPLTFVAENASPDLQAFPKSGVFEIRTPIVLFHKYLQDMVRIKIDVIDKRNDKCVGNIIVNTLLFLKQNVKNTDTQPFEDMDGIFPIIEPQKTCSKPDISKKIGEVEISLSSQFAQQKTKEYGIYQNIKEFLQNNDQNSQNQINTEQNYFEQQQQNLQNLNTEEENLLDQPENQNNNQQQYQQQSQQNLNSQNNLQQQNQQKRDSQNLQIINKLNSNKPSMISIQENQINNDNISQKSYQTQSQSNKNQNFIQNQPRQTQQSRNTTPSHQVSIQEQNKIKSYENQQQFENLKKLSLNYNNKNQNKQNEDTLTERTNYSQKMKELEQQQKRDFYKKLQSQMNQDEQEQLLLQESIEEIMRDNRLNEIEILQLKMDQTELFGKGGEAEGFSDEDEIPDKLPNSIQSKAFKIKEIEKMRIKVQTFKVTNPVYKLRFHQKRVFIECDIPGLQSNGTNIVYSRVTLGQKSEKNLEYFYNQEYPQSLKFNEQNMSKLLTSPYTFRILIENNQSERVFFGSGTFKLEKLILQDSYSGIFQINIENKELQGKLRQQEQEIGQIQIEIQLEKQKKKNQEQNNFNNTNNHINNNQENKIQEKIENLGCQIYLQVHNLSQISQNYQQIQFKYKTYNQNQGSNQVIQSEILQNQPYSQIHVDNNNTTFPVYTQNVLKMEKMPFLIEVWGVETEEFQKKQYQQKLKNFQLKPQKKKLNDLNNQEQIPEFQYNKNQKIIGIAKIPLKSIFHSITTQNYNNQQPQIQISHIKHNLYPIIVAQNQNIEINSIKTQQQEGLINITLAFGTVPQIKQFSNQYLNQNNYQNQRTDDFNQRDGSKLFNRYSPSQSQYIGKDGISNKVNDIILQNKDGLEYSNFKKTLKNVDNSEIFGGQKYNLLEFRPNKSFIMILENIRKNKRKSSLQLREFVVKSQKYNNLVTLKEFYEFITNLPFQDPLKNQMTQKLILTLDYQNSGQIQTNDFSKSYSSYVYFEEIIRQNHCDILQDFRILLKRLKFTTNDLDRHLLRYTEFGFIQKQKFREILLGFTNKEEEEIIVENIIQMLDPGDEGMILSTQLSDYLKNSDIYEGLSHIVPHEQHFLKILESSLAENIYQNQDLVQDYIQNANEEWLKDEKIFYIHDIIEALESFEIEISFWESVCIVDNIQKMLLTKDNTPSLIELGVYYSNLLDYLEYLIRFHKNQLKNQNNNQKHNIQLNDSNLNQISGLQQNYNLQNNENDDNDDLNLQEIADIVNWEQKNQNIECEKGHKMELMVQQQINDFQVDKVPLKCDACRTNIQNQCYNCYQCKQIKCSLCSQQKLEKKDFCQKCYRNNNENPIQKLSYISKNQIVEENLDIQPCTICKSATFPIEYGTYLCNICEFSRCNECYQMSKIY